MSWWLGILVLVIAFGVGLWLASLVVEGLRRVRVTPGRLPWAPTVPIQNVNVGNYRLRYITVGRGPNVVLLHTLRTQLDLFEKVVPILAGDFTVFALDYPGHGYSDIPKGLYDADFFAAAVEDFLNALDLKDVTLGGVSIGGAIALILAGRHNPRVARVVAINPYDYARGRGLGRSGPAGWITVFTAGFPIVGETFNRLRTFMVVKAILLGGVASPASFPPALIKEMYAVGNRRGHYGAFLSLLRHAASWEEATAVYREIAVPVRLVWGDRDWSRLDERDHDQQLLPNAHVVTVAEGGHFLPLDRPDAVIDEIEASAASGFLRGKP